MSSSSAGRDFCPSCRVCGGEASGFHYGVDSCEGCKGFFRRCVTQGMTNHCANEEKCEITPVSRNSCQFCRLKKCFTVGMSREGSRLGRRPKKPKSQDLKTYNQRLNGSCWSSANITSSTADKVDSNISQPPDSFALEKLRLDVSSDSKPSSDLSACYPLRPEDSFSCDGVNCIECRGTPGPSASSTVQSNCPSLWSSPQTTFQRHHKTELERPTKLSPDCLPYEPKVSVCAGEFAGHCQSHSTSSEWSKSEEFNSKDGSAAGRFTRSSSCDFDPGQRDRDSSFVFTSSLTYVKRDKTENDSDIENPFSPLEQHLKTQVSRRFNRCSSDPSGDQTTCEKTTDDQRPKYNTKTSLCHQRLKNKNSNIKTQEEAQCFDGGAPLSVGLSSCEDVKPPKTLEKELPSSVEHLGMMAVDTCGEAGGGGSVAETPQAFEILTSEAMKPPDRVKLQLIEHVIAMVIDAHVVTCNYTSQKVAVGTQRYCTSTAECPASAKRDLDPSKIWNQFVDNMAPAITRVVKFCKKIPGFSELHQEDQIELIKQGSFEVILARYTRLFTDDGMFVPDMTLLVPRDVLCLMPMAKSFEEQFQFAESFNQLKLNDGEVGLLSASMIIFPGRSGLLNSDAIHKLHVLLLQSLYAYMKRSHPVTCDDLFAEAIHILPYIRRINASHAQQLTDLKTSMPQILFPPLHEEVFAKTG